MENFDYPQHSKNQKNIKNDVSIISVASGVIDNVEYHSGTNDHGVKEVPILGDEHGKPKGVNFQKNFDAEHCQKAPLDIFIVGDDDSGVDNDDGIEKIPEEFMFDSSDQDT